MPTAGGGPLFVAMSPVMLSIVFVLPALYMILEAFGGGAGDAFSGMALLAFVVPLPVAYAIHTIMHQHE